MNDVEGAPEPLGQTGPQRAAVQEAPKPSADESKQADAMQAATVTVVCGHLAFARYPVLVGHYRGDMFAGTEALLDKALDGRLTERREMGLYPGPIATSTVLLDSRKRPPGAVVVGLDEPSDLSVGALRRAVRYGVLAFAAAHADDARSAGETVSGDRALGLSTVLVGAGEGGLDRFRCMQALLQGVHEARSMMARVRLPVSLDALEIIEVYEDRADAAHRAAQAALIADNILSRSFDLAPWVRRQFGRRKSGPAGRDPTWWQPIQITMPEESRDERSLFFTIGGGLARAEARTVAANLDLVVPLVRRTSRTTQDDSTRNSTGRALFELLWPPSLKDQSADERPRRLILDERSAAFPWELLDDRRPWLSDSEAQGDPPAVRAGIVRQLLQTQFREEVVTPSGAPKALVIGDPRAIQADGFVELKGAQREAAAVARLLTSNSYKVADLIAETATPEQICRLLFTEAWEIIHISAHGVSNQSVVGPDGTNHVRTGVLLGGGVVLSPSALAKLPVSPRIVFVNCCYLGSLDLAGRPEFAANVAVELVRLGARCVIAAGWAVDDAVAEVFGITFYQEMLRGATFGDATRKAREQAYQTKPESDTWGAYQCYGDPDYRLRDPPRPAQFIALPEAIEAAQQVRDDANIGLERNSTLAARLGEIEQRATARNWFGSAEWRLPRPGGSSVISTRRLSITTRPRLVPTRRSSCAWSSSSRIFGRAWRSPPCGARVRRRRARSRR